MAPFHCVAMCPATSRCAENECERAPAPLPRDCFPGCAENGCQSVKLFRSRWFWWVTSGEVSASLSFSQSARSKFTCGRAARAPECVSCCLITPLPPLPTGERVRLTRCSVGKPLRRGRSRRRLGVKTRPSSVRRTSTPLPVPFFLPQSCKNGDGR